MVSGIIKLADTYEPTVKEVNTKVESIARNKKTVYQSAAGNVIKAIPIIPKVAGVIENVQLLSNAFAVSRIGKYFLDKKTKKEALFVATSA